MNYIPTPGQLPGEQWEPSNGTQGDAFISAWCGRCACDKEANGEATQDECDRDESLRCQILGASFRGEAVEWRAIKGAVMCIAFVPKGEPIPVPRCDKTLDMFQASEPLLAAAQPAGKE